MDNRGKYRHRKVNEIIAVIRVFFVFLIVSSIYSFLPTYLNNSILNIVFVILGLVILSAISLVLWDYFLKTSVQTLELRKQDIVYSVLEILLLTFIIYMTGAHESRYKNLYFIAIITSSIRFGVKMGILSSALSTAGIIFNDMVYQLNQSINSYLEADIIIIITFFITGWMLGMFMESEIKYRERLSEKANTDEVTGLYNHRYFQEQLKIEIENAKANGYKLGLIIIDLDYFKFYNDTFGHQQGDILLKDIGNMIKQSIRSTDLVCRYGGDEFAIILPDIEAEEAAKIGEDIRVMIEGRKFFEPRFENNKDITASVGVAIYPANASDKDELIKKADEAMYKAKFMNKNKVELYFSVLDDLKASLNESDQNLLNSTRTLITVINAKDKYTYGHSERVVIYSTIIGNALKLDEVQLKKLRYGAYLHDIGKIEISRDILNKKTSLTQEEWAVLKNHPVWGADILKPIAALKDSIPAVLYHHERFDGRGYPFGLKGHDIPECARILAVADSFDAMTTKRPYRNAQSFDEAIEELKRCSGQQFDPFIVEKFIEALREGQNELVS